MKSVKLSDKVFTFTQENALFAVPCHLLVAVSGGPDSMALLHTLMHWPQDGLRLSVVHMNHGLRNSAADDEAFLRCFCTSRNLNLTVISEDVAAYAEQYKLGLEEAGRELRYQRFEQLRQSLGADRIVTAHTASDQVETMLMHLLRGCGLDALCGIPAKRECICRPMLTCSRSEVLSYCHENQIPYVIDETNTDVHFTRNRVRHEILPLLREVNPSADDALLRFQHHVTEDVLYLDTLAQDLLIKAQCKTGYKIPTLAETPTPIRRRAIRLILRQLRLKTIEEAHICAVEHLIMTGQGKALLPGRFIAKAEQGILSLSSEEKSSPTEPFCYRVSELPFSFNNGLYNYTITRSSENVHNLFAKCAIDYDTIQGTLFIRSRQAGDILRPAGRGISKSIKKLMNEWEIPVEIRDSIPLLCDDEGVLLVPGYACDQRAAVTDQTKHFLILQQQ